MMTVEVTVACDRCKIIIAASESQDSFFHACEQAERKATSHGAQINVASVTCAECLAKQCSRCGEKDPCACEPATQGKVW